MFGNYEYEIKPDYDNLTISLGDWSFDCTESSRFHRAGSILKIVQEVLTHNGLGVIPYKLGEPYTKQVYQTFADKFKMKPKTFINIVNKLHYKVLVEGLSKSVLHSVCYSGACNRELSIPRNYREVKPLLKQCMRDGIHNVAPLVAITGMDTKTLKSSLGKGLWKKYCKRSLTANAIVANTLRRHKGGIENKVHLLRDLYNTPVTFLKYHHHNFDDLAPVAARICKEERCVSKIGQVTHTLDIVRDTYRMARELGENFNPNWSWKRFNEEHDRLTLLQLEEEYSADKFSATAYKKLPQKFSCEHGVAKLLTSEIEVAREGRVMHHCVAGYARICTSGTYAVYHIVDKSGNESTLGLKYGGRYYMEGADIRWNIDQHYTYSNGTPTRYSTNIAQELINNLQEDY